MDAFDVVDDRGRFSVRPSGAEGIRHVWCAELSGPTYWCDMAREFWGFAFSAFPDGSAQARLIGPSLEPLVIVDPRPHGRHWGLELESWVFVRRPAKPDLLDSVIEMPVLDGWFELAGVRYAVPDVDGLEGLVSQLSVQGVLHIDAAVRALLEDDVSGLPPRTAQRRTRAVTGLSRRQLGQVQRVRRAYGLMQQGHSLAAAALDAGFSDQAHMTRAFGLLIGMTPARIADDELRDRLLERRD